MGNHNSEIRNQSAMQSIRADLNEGREEEFSDSDPELVAGLYRIKTKEAVWFDDTFKGFANLEFVLERGDEKVPVPDTIFVDAKTVGDPLLVYQKYPYFIREINIFEHSKNIARRLLDQYRVRIFASEKNKLIAASRLKTGKMLQSITKKTPAKKSVHQQLIDLNSEIQSSPLGDSFYKNRRVKNLIGQRKDKFGPDFLNSEDHLNLWKQEWKDFQDKHQKTSEEERIKKSQAVSIDDLMKAYKVKGPAQKDMLKDIEEGGKVPVDSTRLQKYMDRLADRYLVNRAAAQFADITKGLKRLINDLKNDDKIQNREGYYVFKGAKNG